MRLVRENSALDAKFKDYRMASGEVLSVLSGFLTLASVGPYIRDILRGRTVPHRTSWVIFAALAAIATGSQIRVGASSGAWMTAGAALGFSIVSFLSIRRGVGGFERSDALTLGIVIAGMVAWLLTNEAIVALVATITVEVAAIVLTVRKAFIDPWSETLSTWVLDALAGLTAICAVAAFNFSKLLYPVHHLVANLAVALSIVCGRARRSRSGSVAPNVVNATL